MGGSRRKCSRMFKYSRRTYRQKPRGPATTNLATMTTNINDTNTTTTSVWILSPQGWWGSLGWGICDLKNRSICCLCALKGNVKFQPREHLEGTRHQMLRALMKNDMSVKQRAWGRWGSYGVLTHTYFLCVCMYTCMHVCMPARIGQRTTLAATHLFRRQGLSAAWNCVK